MITKIGTYRGYDLFFQDTTDFCGVYAQPQIPHYLGQTFAEACATIDAMLDEEPEVDMPFDVELAAKLNGGE